MFSFRERLQRKRDEKIYKHKIRNTEKKKSWKRYKHKIRNTEKKRNINIIVDLTPTTTYSEILKQTVLSVLLFYILSKE